MPHLSHWSRLVPVVQGFANYGNPFRIAIKRKFTGNGLMTITDRSTGVTVDAAINSYQMFGETWYNRDYDVPGCPLRKDDTAIDIGANQGFFSCYAASKGARVHAFEPFPENCRRLRANVDHNGFSSRTVIRQAAVSGDSGTATLLCSDFLGGGGNTLIEAHAKGNNHDIKQSIQVEKVSISDVLNQIQGQIRLCKMDCEGSEIDIVRTLSSPDRIDSFAVEFHPQAYPIRELIGTMRAWGTHQVSFSKTAAVIYAVRNEILFQYGESYE
jgi:FkbM family methyltransferase